MFRRFAPLCAKSLARRPHPAATLHPRIARPKQAEKADEAMPPGPRRIRRQWNDRFGMWVSTSQSYIHKKRETRAMADATKIQLAITIRLPQEDIDERHASP